MQIGIDIGGTFTDGAFVDAQDRLRVLKVPSTPAAPEEGVDEAFARAKAKATEADRFVHGTTIITNLLIERDGGSVGLVTSAGFEDVLEAMHGDKPNTFDLTWRKPQPFVPRPNRFGVRERVDWDGSIFGPLEDAEVERLIGRLRGAGCDSVAVCLLNAHANSDHEERLAAEIRRALPEVHCCTSSEVDPAIREYERASTTVLNAYSMPAVSTYITEQADNWGDVQFMTSSGGAVEARVAADLPISLAFSGPAGGVVGASAVAEASGYGDLITFDMGGTSTDVAIVRGGKPEITLESEVEWGIPYRFPSLDIKSVGAGGGSLLWVDDGGALRVGPQSAGVSPGPACYGRGGVGATVTDVNVELGLVPGESFGGGSVRLDRDAAAGALRRLADKSGHRSREVAQGAWRIVNATMAQAIRQVTVYKGIDPRGFTLFAFGSAAGQHAVSVASELRMPRVVIPAAAPVFSAVGMLAARLEVYGSCPIDGTLESVLTEPKVIDRLASLETELARESPQQLANRAWTLEIRHVGQTRTLHIDFDPASDDAASVRQRFDREHRRLYGMSGETEVEVVNARLTLATPDPDHRAWRPEVLPSDEDLLVRAAGSHAVSLEGGQVETAARASMSTNDSGAGPILIADATSTVYVPSGCQWSIDDYGSMVVTTNA